MSGTTALLAGAGAMVAGVALLVCVLRGRPAFWSRGWQMADENMSRREAADLELLEQKRWQAGAVAVGFIALGTLFVWLEVRPH